LQEPVLECFGILMGKDVGDGILNDVGEKVAECVIVIGAHGLEYIGKMGGVAD
jgi:hypothetical protein